jgi:hypothetical protein
MGSCEILKKFRKVETRLEDVNPLEPLSQFTAKNSPFKLRDDVANALDIAVAEIERVDVSPGRVAGYYLVDEEGIVDKLEIRNLSPELARRIYNQTVVANLGGFIETSLDGKKAKVGLPHPVNVFKRVEVEKGK